MKSIVQCNYKSRRKKKKIEEFEKSLKVIFAGIAYTNRIEELAKYEWYYSSAMYCMLSIMWFDMIYEDITNQWRIDLTIKLKEKILIIEFKVEKWWEKAIKQIKEKRYYEKYLNENKDIYLLWIDFDKEKRNVKEIEVEKITK